MRPQLYPQWYWGQSTLSAQCFLHTSYFTAVYAALQLCFLNSSEIQQKHHLLCELIFYTHTRLWLAQLAVQVVPVSIILTVQHFSRHTATSNMQKLPLPICLGVHVGMQVNTMGWKVSNIVWHNAWLADPKFWNCVFRFDGPKKK